MLVVKQVPGAGAIDREKIFENREIGGAFKFECADEIAAET